MSQSLNQFAGVENKDVHFASRQESVFPHLMRLSMDFGLQVVDREHKFCLCAEDDAITPAQDSLEALERYVQAHMVDILHSYLFQAEDALAH